MMKTRSLYTDVKRASAAPSCQSTRRREKSRQQSRLVAFKDIAISRSKFINIVVYFWVK